MFNHCGGGFRQFQDVVEHGEQSLKDWFYIREFPVSFDPINFDAFGTTPMCPALGYKGYPRGEAEEDVHA